MRQGSSQFPSVFMSLVAFGGLLIPACGDDSSGADAMPAASCLEADHHSDLAGIQENIFTPSCSAFTACHRGAAQSAEGLNMEDGNTEQNLVGVPSKLFPEFDLIVPGSAPDSYLMIILGQFEGPLTDKGTMPFNNPLLCKPKRDAIERWADYRRRKR